MSAPESLPEPAREAPDGVIARLRARTEQNKHGRRLVLQLPGWTDVGNGESLWARFPPFTREQQIRFGGSPNIRDQEIDVMAALACEACEEILIGTIDARRPLANEPGVAELREDGGPLNFGADLGAVLGLGRLDPVAIVKRMLIHSNDDLPFYSIMGELANWSGNVTIQQAEAVAGE